MFFRICATALTLGLATPAFAAVTPYSDYTDFASLTTIGATGFDIDTSTDVSGNTTLASNTGEQGVRSDPNGGPLEFTGINGFEVGMTFGNDQMGNPGTSGIFDVVLEAYSGAILLGSVTVTSNGNDLSDQFIGFGTTTAFDRVVLDYKAPADPRLARFITEVRFGLDAPAPIPLPAALPLLLLGLGGLGLARARKAA
ncbi:VPLPA-CTERM sorting domain-containing protein [Dinoroseobacter sp. S124A]|uniref:VPLPA-CTERM sorting domain-containing protein n=1 Tax=Dinoroseobacter sp. S124A TaxID=3415128 RepID=UPI003C7DB58F